MSLLNQLHSLQSQGVDTSRALVSPDNVEIGHAPLGFRGHNVSVRPGAKCVTDARGMVETALRERYGDRIVDHMMNQRDLWGNPARPLTLRRAIMLDKTAATIQSNLTSSNLRSARTMLSRELDGVITSFQQRHELTTPLTPDERRSILNQAGQKLLSNPMMNRRHVKPEDVKRFLNEALINHYTEKSIGFREGMSEITEELGINVHSMEDLRAELDDLGEASFEAANGAIRLLARGNQLLTDCPIGKDDVELLGEDAGALINDIDEQMELLQAQITGGDDSPVLSALKNELDSMKDKLESHVDYQTNFLSSDPTTKQNLEKAVWFHTRAALLAIDDLIQQHPGQTLGLQALRHQIEQHGDNELLAAANGDQHVEDIGEYLETGRGAIDTMLTDGLRNLGLELDGEKLIHKKGAEAQNIYGDFDVIVSTYKHRMGEKSYDITSEITPGQHIPHLRDSYQQDGVRGISSGSSRESRHCVNLAYTKAQSEDGTTIFKAVRHGVLSAFGIPQGIIARIKGFFGFGDPHARATANTARAMEVVTTSLTMDQDLVRRAIVAAGQGQTVDMDISSIGLLTPDNTRRFLDFATNGAVMGSSNEFEQMNDQFKAWKSVEGIHTITVENPDVPGQMVQVRVKVDTLAFNFGVNEGAQKGKFGFDSKWRHTGGWQNCKEQNQVAMEKLFGDISTESAPLGGKLENFLNRDDVSEEDKQVVRELATQIRFMWNNEAYQQQLGEPYKMVARLAVLCDKIGLKVAFNCKSGKDRTGMLDAEAKYLAAYIKHNGRVPELGRTLTPQEKQNVRDSVLRGGGLPMQRNNVGLGGYKLGGVDDNYVRTGMVRRRKSDVIDPDAMRAMEGGGDFVNE